MCLSIFSYTIQNVLLSLEHVVSMILLPIPIEDCVDWCMILVVEEILTGILHSAQMVGTSVHRHQSTVVMDKIFFLELVVGLVFGTEE